MRAFILISVISLTLLASNTMGAPIYKWQGADGTVHYSSKPANQGAKQAELPPIMRGEVKIPKNNLVSCKEHGGANCQLGADKDGSVICYDGFKDAAARYRFSCNSPKLEISEVSDPAPDGTFKVFVRNSTSVTASNAALFYKPDVGREAKLEGPLEIEPYGLVEYIFKPSGDQTIIAKADIGSLNITCSNCP